ncbi:unnamed protein product [Urochloa humidicola]
MSSSVCDAMDSGAPDALPLCARTNVHGGVGSGSPSCRLGVDSASAGAGSGGQTQTIWARDGRLQPWAS